MKHAAAWLLRALRGGLAAALLIGSAAHAADWTTNDGPRYGQTTAGRVLAEHRADEARRLGAALERQINGIPGNPGSVTVSDRWKGPSPKVGDIIDVEVKRVIPWAATGRAVARALPLVGNALVIADILDSLRCREALGGGPECDPGRDQALTPTQCWSDTIYAPGCFSSPGAAAQAAAEVIDANNRDCPHGTYRVTGSAGAVSGSGSVRTVVVPFTGHYCSDGSLAVSVGNRQITVYLDTQNQLACPPITVNGTSIVPTTGPDGKCPTLVYQPTTEDQFADKWAEWADKAKAVDAAREAIEAQVPIPHDPPVHDPVPAGIVGDRTQTKLPDGSTVVRDKSWTLEPDGLQGYKWTEKTTEKTYPPGAVIPPPGELGEGGTESTGAPSDIITCGLPGTPPCKIDEAGTPPPKDPFDDPGRGGADWFKGLFDFFSNPQVADTQWSWSFALPTSCSVMSVGPFLGIMVEFDLCQYQPMIHDILSIVWAAAGIWFAVGMVGRTLGG